MASSSNEKQVPTALLDKVKETRARDLKRQAQEARRQEMFEQQQSDFSREELNELEHLLDGETSQNFFASLPKGSIKKTSLRRQRKRKKYIKKYSDVDRMRADLESGLITCLDFTEFRKVYKVGFYDKIFIRISSFRPKKVHFTARSL